MGRPLLEKDIKHAQRETKSHAEAARFLNVAFTTYKRYARAYNLYETEHKNPAGKGISKLKSKGTFGISEILAGKHPNYDRHKLKDRLVRAGYLEHQCSICGHANYRPDGRGPYTLDYVDGDRNNLTLENLKLICYNCQYLTTGRVSLTADIIVRPDTGFTDRDFIEVLGEDDMEQLREELQNGYDDQSV